MIVVIAGMQRSGSTFVFNIARELMVGQIEAIPANSVDEAQLARARGQNLLLKAHMPDETLARLIRDGSATCICSHRKPEEAVASWMQTFGFGFDESLNTINAWLEWHHQFPHPMLNIPYELIEDRPLRAILMIQQYLLGAINRKLASELRQKYDKATVKHACDALAPDENVVDIGFSYYNPLTFFHRRHVSSVGKRDVSATLTSEQISKVRAAMAEYIDENGEYIAPSISRLSVKAAPIAERSNWK